MRSTHLIGLFLWRGGLLLAGAAAAYETARLLLRLIDVPAELTVGLALLLAGFVFLLGSLVAERQQDAKLEQGLTE